ncbi:MAG: DUF4399 domain-containing protein [Idiomarina sp.]
MKNLGLLLTAGLSAGILMMPAAEAHQHKSHSERTEAPADAVAYIISPQNGEKVSTKFKVKFGLTGMGVAPAGVDAQHTGHHHLMVDKQELPALDKPMGGDVIHFGAGQTETELELEPGEHTLQIILGDMNHVPHDPVVVSEVVTITVVED